MDSRLSIKSPPAPTLTGSPIDPQKRSAEAISPMEPSCSATADIKNTIKLECAESGPKSGSGSLNCGQIIVWDHNRWRRDYCSCRYHCAGHSSDPAKEGLGLNATLLLTKNSNCKASR